MATDLGCCPSRKCEKPCSGCDCAGSCSGDHLEALPDAVLQQHLLPRLGAADKKILRLTCPRQRQLINQCVAKVVVPAKALQASPPGTRLGDAFPAARTLQAHDSPDASISDATLMAFLGGSPAWLAALRDADLKGCHYVTPALLNWLRAAAPRLRKLSPSRWTDHAGLAAIAAFPALQELDLGDADTDIITIDDLGLSALLGLAGSLSRLGLSRCRWISDAACATLSKLGKLEALALCHTDVGPRGLAELAALPLLARLDLSGCRNIGDAALGELGALAALTSLSLRGTPATNAGLGALARLPRLAAVDLGSKWELDDAGLGAVAGCPELRALAAGSFNLVAPLSGGNGRGLQKLEHLSFGGGFANKGLGLLFPLLNLRSLFVAGIDSVTDGVMRGVAASQRQLMHLSLRSGYSLTPAGLGHLASLANLAVLSVGACPGVNAAALADFVARHARLCRLSRGACPLLADGGEALCALADEHTLAGGWPAAAARAG